MTLIHPTINRKFRAESIAHSARANLTPYGPSSQEHALNPTPMHQNEGPHEPLSSTFDQKMVANFFEIDGRTKAG